LRQRLGQHFLVSESILEKIAAAACPTREPLVIEIGPGRGALTERLLERADRVIAIELDPALAALIRRRYAGSAAFTLLEADALQVDLSQWGPAVVAGNLPYYIATPLLTNAARLGSTLQRAVFLTQKEVAARATAEPGGRDYGYLSVLLRLFTDACVLFDVKPTAFRPPPKVDSSALRLTPHARAEELEIRDTAAFLEFVSQCFRHKRKTLRNNLLPLYAKEAVDSLPEAGLRAETLPLAAFARIYRGLVP
jgi:16S rRNA (adenine1518-N6/adenine1519-N6)-dimethyltransferase